MLRQGAGLTTLQTLFDQLDRSQKLLGRVILEVIQNNFTPGKVKRIIEEEPTPEFYNKTFGKYDAVIEEGFNTSTQRQMNFAQLLQLRELGIPIPNESLLDAATIQNKTKLIEQHFRRRLCLVARYENATALLVSVEPNKESDQTGAPPLGATEYLVGS